MDENGIAVGTDRRCVHYLLLIFFEEDENIVCV